MTFTYCYRDTALDMAEVIALQDEKPMAVFEGRSSGADATFICPLGEFGGPAGSLILFVEPAL
jgi:hypothetical protein